MTNAPTSDTVEEELSNLFPELDKRKLSLLRSTIAQRVLAARVDERAQAESDLGFDEEAAAKYEELCAIVQNKGIVYMSLQTGRVISEEDYLDFEDWVSSVGKPEGSVVERHLKIDIAALTSKDGEGKLTNPSN